MTTEIAKRIEELRNRGPFERSIEHPDLVPSDEDQAELDELAALVELQKPSRKNAIKKRAAMYARIERHGAQLLAIFPDAIERDPIKLCKKLRRIEAAAHRDATDWCNGDIDSETWEARSVAHLEYVLNLLGDGPPIFCNGDARGYTLKIDDEYMRANAIDLHRDWGGYGIIAPDLSED